MTQFRKGCGGPAWAKTGHAADTLRKNAVAMGFVNNGVETSNYASRYVNLGYCDCDEGCDCSCHDEDDGCCEFITIRIADHESKPWYGSSDWEIDPEPWCVYEALEKLRHLISAKPTPAMKSFTTRTRKAVAEV